MQVGYDIVLYLRLKKYFVGCDGLSRSHSCTHRWTFADETMRCVTGNSTRPSISAGSSFAAVEHFITTLTWRTEVKRLNTLVKI